MRKFAVAALAAMTLVLSAGALAYAEDAPEIDFHVGIVTGSVPPRSGGIPGDVR